MHCTDEDIINFITVGIVGKLTESPQNAVGLKTDVITLRCSSSTSNDIQWLRNNAVITTRSCRSVNPVYTATYNGTNDCFLMVQGNYTSRVSGKYTCSSGSTVQNAKAIVIIIGQ